MKAIVIFVIASLLFLVANPFQVICQTASPLYNNHTEFETKDGLPQSYVSGILQDHDGFMWFSTPDGLARYDGHEFLTFRSLDGDSTSLSYNNIHDIVLDKYNVMWIVYFNGMVDKMDLRTFRVTRDIPPVLDPDTLSAPFAYLNDFIRDWNVDDQGKYWFYSYQGRLEVFDSSKVELAAAYHEQGKNSEVIYGYAEDPMDRLWLLRKDGFEVSDESWKSFRKITFPANLKFDADSSLYRGIINLPGNRMMTAVRGRLVFYNYETKTFSTQDLPPVPTVHQKPVRIVTKDRQGRVVIAYQGYVFRMEENGEITLLWKCPESSYATICSLYFDKSNTLWIATNGYGLYKVNMLTPAIEAHEYEINMLADILVRHLKIPKENLPKSWLGMRSKQFWLRYYYDQDSTLIVVNRSDLRDDDNKVFFQLDRKEFKVLPIPKEKSIVGLDGNMQGELWGLTSESDLYHWTDYETTASFITVPMMGADPAVNIGAFDLEVDEDYLWVATKFNGLYKIKGHKVVSKYLPGDDPEGIGRFELTDIITDPLDANILWVGTLGDGLIRWNKKLDRTESRITTEDGLVDNNIQGVLPDRHGYLWLSTLRGLSKYDPATGDVTNYSSSDGLYEDEFLRFYHFVLPDGRFAFGGINGYSVIDPLSFQPDTLKASLAFSHFYVNNQRVYPVHNPAILDQPVNAVQKIVLTYDQNSFGIDLAALQFNQPHRNLFRYRLEGYDDTWIEAGNNYQVRYNKLPPGSYKFHAMTSNTSGEWNEEVKSLAIIITPPFWLSWWAYAGYSAVLLLIIRTYRNYDRTKIKKQQEFEFSQREAERFKNLNKTISEQAENLKLANRTKDRLFSIISHDLRGPMASFESIAPLIKSYSQKKQPEKIDQLVDHVDKSAHSLNQLLDNLLNWSLSQEGEIKIEIERLRLSDTVDEVFEIYKDAAEAKGVRLISEVKDEMILADKHTFSTVVRNLVSNALKFSQPGGEIHVQPRREDNFVQIAIKDQGIGIPKERISGLFEIDKSKVRTGTANERGTGLGLVLVKEFVELNKGTLKLESEEGQGTVIYVKMPLAS